MLADGARHAVRENGWLADRPFHPIQCRADHLQIVGALRTFV